MSKVSYDSTSSLLTIQLNDSENFTIKYPNYSGAMSDVEIRARVSLEKLNSILTSDVSFLSLGKRLLSAISAVRASISVGAGLFLSRIHSAVASHFMTRPELVEIPEEPTTPLWELGEEIPAEDPASERAIIHHVVGPEDENVSVDYRLELIQPDLSELDLEDRTY
jgi:hypothetical protein